MKVDDIQLLAALKREQKNPPKAIPEDEKVRGVDEVHAWLMET